jgi:histidine triad (HIT) family protein
MEDSIFTKIIKGELPCHRVYEDDMTLAFLPLHPIAKGHVLVVPKMQVDAFYDLPEENYHALMAVVRKIAQHMKETLQTRRVGLQLIGLDVPHSHIHVIAFDNLEEFREKPDETIPPDHSLLSALAEKLAM